jgi:glucose-6-phosphate dehydrogenase assembly protein OpcA
LTTVAEIERELSSLRAPGEGYEPAMRTSVMTHLAWVPDEWLPAAHEVLSGLAERHPSRTIVLVPQPDAPDGMEADVDQQCFPLAGSERSICTETIEVRLGGEFASRPASIVEPLLIADLPVFCRWRGEPPWGGPELEQLADLVDRLVIDSREWREPATGYAKLVELFDSTAVSDIGWSVTYDWRLALAKRWPAIAKQEIVVGGPAAEASLLRGWLGARLKRQLRPVESADALGVQLDGEVVEPPRTEPRSPADLLSDELDKFSRDSIYEEAVRTAAS